MAVGKKDVVAVTLTDTTIQVVRDDSILTNGSLLLLDTGQSSRPLLGTSGIPATAAVLPNVADSLARALIPSGELGATLVLGSALSGAGSSKGKTERTAKGGLHTILTQASSLTAGDATVINAVQISDAILGYLAANNSHDYYASLWARITRAVPSADGTGRAMAGVQYGSAISTNPGLFLMFQAGRTDNPGGSIGVSLGNHKSLPAAGAAGLAYNSLGARGFYGTGAPSGVPAYPGGKSMAVWGPSNPTSQAIGSGAPSWIFYRAYIEDLTVSGRSYAQVDALDFARWTADFATGGRFVGDTFTDPATLP